ncbi:MAG: hypothetical protein KDB39_18010 [Austwickia sp.]|nr:hypothetical protein [Austwickia sp.]HRW00660.1 hypothetical protein [Tetrasphaera sp.]
MTARWSPSPRRPAPAPSRHHEAGSGTILTIVLVAAMIILLPATLGLVTAVQAKQRARAAADLGAIAAVSNFMAGLDAATSCRRAAGFVTANAAQPTGCYITPEGTATVTARVTARLPVVGMRTTTTSARAGPVRQR